MGMTMKALSRITLVTLLVISFSVTIYAQEAVWINLMIQSDELYQQGRYSEATRVTEEALKIAENTFGPYHPNVRTTLFRLAATYGAQGKHTEAEDLYKWAVEIGFDFRAVDQKEEKELGLGVRIFMAFFLGLLILAILAAIVFSVLWDTECPKCHKYLAIKSIAKTKLELFLYKYKYRCKYCNYEFERKKDTTSINILPYW
jgi:tetratricopeptide (TPR) repeat protein